MFGFKIFLFLLWIGSLNADQVTYRNYTVLRALPQTMGQLESLRSLQMESETDQSEAGFDFWTAPNNVNQTVDIMASPDTYDLLKEWLDNRSIEYKMMIDDLQGEIEKSSPRDSYKAFEGDIEENFEEDVDWVDSRKPPKLFASYHRYSTIETVLLRVLKRNPKVKVGTFARTTEGRSIYLLRVSTDYDAKKPVIFMDAGHHAREWISHSTMIYLIWEAIYGTSPKLTSCIEGPCPTGDRAKLDLDRFEYWFIPVVNPDGYEYSHTVDRMWRKTRSPNPGRGCAGTDPNRNYKHHWKESGTSSNPCSAIYGGRAPFTEPETRAVANMMRIGMGRIKMYVSLHAYSQLILTPYGYTKRLPRGYAEIERVAIAARNAIASVRGIQYRYGPSSRLLYTSSGGSDDYAYDEGKIQFSYTIELPDKGEKGFVLPASEIVPVGFETLVAIRAMTDAISLE